MNWDPNCICLLAVHLFLTHREMSLVKRLVLLAITSTRERETDPRLVTRVSGTCGSMWRDFATEQRSHPTS